MSAPKLPASSRFVTKKEYDRAIRNWLQMPYPSAAKLKAATNATKKGSRRVSAE
ncbi:MAG: hypothetical protein P1Q69_10545 [Candidatus Thorarchaeota archaeon]|nr:hypothetical protein [Candidatus Thorarchaeota archaeon]